MKIMMQMDGKDGSVCGVGIVINQELMAAFRAGEFEYVWLEAQKPLRDLIELALSGKEPDA